MEGPDQVNQAEGADESARGQRKGDVAQRAPGQQATQPLPGGSPGRDQEEEARLDAIDDEEDAKERVEAHGRPDPTPTARGRALAQPCPPRGGGFEVGLDELEPEEGLDLGGVERVPPEEEPPLRGAADVVPGERGDDGAE